jgi:hypothetical protein
VTANPENETVILTATANANARGSQEGEVPSSQSEEAAEIGSGIEIVTRTVIGEIGIESTGVVKMMAEGRTMRNGGDAATQEDGNLYD